MKNYWGNKAVGHRKGFGYVPELYGFLFYKAQDKHPIHIEGKSIAELGVPRYLGYDLDKSKQPVFSFSAGNHTIQFTPRIGPDTQTLQLTLATAGKEKISYKSPKTQIREVSSEPGKLVVVIRPNAGDRYSSDQKATALKEATIAKGEELYNSMGCVACHTTDGGLNHGPTFKDLAGSHREFITASAQKADDAYLIESIQNPGAKTVKGYLMGMMPPYQLQPLSMILSFFLLKNTSRLLYEIQFSLRSFSLMISSTGWANSYIWRMSPSLPNYLQRLAILHLIRMANSMPACVVGM